MRLIFAYIPNGKRFQPENLAMPLETFKKSDDKNQNNALFVNSKVMDSQTPNFGLVKGGFRLK